MNSKIDIQEIYKNCLNNEDFAYWVGVAQTDGYFKRQFVKSIRRERFFIVLGVGPKSLPMQNKFKEISQKLLGRGGSTCVMKRKEGFTIHEYKFGCKNLIDLFNKFKINFSSVLIPPPFVLNNDSLFGAYIAGVIDGDGDITIRRKQYPQCYIRITGSCEPTDLIQTIKSRFNCGVYTEHREKKSQIASRRIVGHFQITEFIISPKNYDLIAKYVLKHISLPHKRDKIIEYYKIRGWPARVEMAGH